MAEPEVLEGWVDAGLAAEFPGLRVAWTGARAGRERAVARRRCASACACSRTGSAAPQAIALRGRDVPHAYRVFFRHVGLEPDETRIPVEALVVERLRLGGFPSRGRLPDALAIACVETGVPVWALDADALDGPPGVRPATAADAPVPQGRLVLADASRALAVLFEAPQEPHARDPPAGADQRRRPARARPLRRGGAVDRGRGAGSLSPAP